MKRHRFYSAASIDVPRNNYPHSPTPSCLVWKSISHAMFHMRSLWKFWPIFLSNHFVGLHGHRDTTQLLSMITSSGVSCANVIATLTSRIPLHFRGPCPTITFTVTSPLNPTGNNIYLHRAIYAPAKYSMIGPLIPRSSIVVILIPYFHLLRLYRPTSYCFKGIIRFIRIGAMGTVRGIQCKDQNLRSLRPFNSMNIYWSLEQIIQTMVM